MNSKREGVQINNKLKKITNNLGFCLFAESLKHHLKSQKYNTREHRAFVKAIRDGPPLREFGEVIIKGFVLYFQTLKWGGMACF